MKAHGLGTRALQIMAQEADAGEDLNDEVDGEVGHWDTDGEDSEDAGTQASSDAAPGRLDATLGEEAGAAGDDGLQPAANGLVEGRAPVLCEAG